MFRTTAFEEQDAYEMAREAISQAFLLLLGGELEGARGLVSGALQNFSGAMITSDAERLMRMAELVSEIGRLASDHVGDLEALDPCGPTRAASSNVGENETPGGVALAAGGVSSSAGEGSAKDECPVEIKAQDPAGLANLLPLASLLEGFAKNINRPDDPNPLKSLLEGAIRDPFLLPVAAKAASIYPSNLLLYGPGGTGKTELSRALARESNLWYIEVGSADIKSKWVGQADKCLRKLFLFAKNLAKETRFADEHELDPSRKNGVLIFIDEIDGLLGEDEGSDSNLGNIVTAFKTEVQSKVLNQLGVVLVGATNRPWTIRDRSVVQRFGIRAYLGLPSISERIKLFDNAVKSYARKDLPNCFPPEDDPEEMIQLGRESVGMSRREIDDFVRQTFSALPVGLSHYDKLKYCAKDGGLSFVARPADAEGDVCDPSGYGTWEQLFESKPDASGTAYEDPEKIERQARICWPAPTTADLLSALRSGRFVKSTTTKDLERYLKFAKTQTSDAEAFLVQAIEREIQEALQFSNAKKANRAQDSSAIAIEPTYDARENYNEVVSEATKLLRGLPNETPAEKSSSSSSPPKTKTKSPPKQPPQSPPETGGSQPTFLQFKGNRPASQEPFESRFFLPTGSEELSPEMPQRLQKPFPPARSVLADVYVAA